MTDKQLEALRLAGDLDFYISIGGNSAQNIMEKASEMIRTQHAALERKDALLRQALEALIPEAAAHTVETKQTRAVEAIRKELQ